ncbi:Intraflagellar transport protein 43 [Phytophthora cactorum]|nr:Intraflagellar transport protein 43 [Phytophthora cactorum]
MPSDAKESKDSDARGDAKRGRAAFDVDDETVLADDAKKPPMRASIGWGNETTLVSEGKEGGGTPDPDTTPAASGSSTSETKRGGRRRKGSEAVASGGERRNQKNRYFEEDDETTDIMEIPDLEEEEREQDITTMGECFNRHKLWYFRPMLYPPVQSLKQLDKEIKFALPSAQTHGVDLHLLTSALCPERAVSEEDEPWDFDALLNDIAQEIQKDLDDKEEF